ncbi:MAG: DUF192 domain-containing protein [Halobacteria archaeon]|nr:DUF192 domain-containing protein [Halobacteria archaeon]
MPRKSIVSVTLVVVLLVTAGCIAGNGTDKKATGTDGDNCDTSSIEVPEGANNTATATFVVDCELHTVTLEIADTPEERSKGLMFRDSLAENHGMLFVYQNEAHRSFWMKNTYIPLDMVFVDGNGRVINVEHAAPYNESGLKSYESDAPAQYVIEVNRGYANRTGIEKGTKVILEYNATVG